MLEARPYDSIEFFHVQRELVKYLGLEPQRRASVTDYIMSMGLSQRMDSRAPVLAAGTGPAAGAGAESEGLTATASRASSAPSCTRSATHAPGFWKRLRSRWRRGGGSSGDEFKGEGDTDVAAALRKP
ncbi:hypothetical protein R5R35_005777 [Gryllus longicercus]|uniref:Uncharacterized protein n=1 Tax=Gryllus longicercus TaxID=2509291 RepID=A0AAN9W3M0_9ORTH